MNIERVNLYQISMALQSPFETSFGRIDRRDCVIIEVFSEGLLGFGECVADRDPGYSYETTQTAWHVLRDFMLPAIIHQDINSPEGLQSRLDFIRGHPMAKAGVEMAIWDLLGKRDGVSLRQMIGGVRQRVDVGVSIGIQESSSELVRTVQGYLDKGYRRIKIKIKPGRDVLDAGAVRQAFPELRLQVDANSAYTLDTAQRLLPLDDLNLLLIEQPLFEDDLWDHRKLQAEFKTAVCLDESILSARHARQAIEMEACKIINVKTGRVGGVSEAVAVHDMCYANAIPVWCGGMLETGIGRAANLAVASLPGFTLPGDISATERYYQEDITYEHFSLNSDSTIDVPDASGLGVTINPLALKKVTLSEFSI
jgi:o-succinylbenzoate synthase